MSLNVEVHLGADLVAGGVMIEFAPVFEDGRRFVFERDHGRCLMLFEAPLRERAAGLGVRAPKDFDGFLAIERALDARSDTLTAQEWLGAYADALEDATPTWFDPAIALPEMQALAVAVRAAASGDEHQELLADSLELLVAALESAARRKTRFHMAMM